MYAWTHDLYRKDEPIIKNIEVRIHKDNYIGEIVYRETVLNVHHDNAYETAEKVLQQYIESLTN